MQCLRAFARATGDALWNTAVNRAYGLIDRMQRAYSPNCGLMPDFVINTDTSTPAPSSGCIGDGVATEVFYDANAATRGASAQPLSPRLTSDGKTCAPS